MNIFFDTEFTGLHKDTKLISIGLISEDERMFYAEFNDYQDGFRDAADIQWIQEHVIPNLKYNAFDVNIYPLASPIENFKDWVIKADTKTVTEHLREWFLQFDKVEMWSDCLAYDWVLFCDLFGGAMNIPENIYYIPYDICTLFKAFGYDPDVNREEFAKLSENAQKHNSLWDAKVIKACYDRMMQPNPYLDCEYVKKLNGLSPEMRRTLLYGEWDVKTEIHPVKCTPDGNAYSGTLDVIPKSQNPSSCGKESGD